MAELVASLEHKPGPNPNNVSDYKVDIRIQICRTRHGPCLITGNWLRREIGGIHE